MLLLLLLASVAHAQLLSPGPLANAHENVDGDNDCSKCHESGKQVVARLCLDCHKDLGVEIAASRGLHGKAYKGNPCEDCHVEHLGRGAKLIRWPGGVMDKLDHKDTGWPLDGGHQGPACTKCHTRTSPLGKLQFVSTPTTCSGCHADPHKGRFTQTCQKCHDEVKWQHFDQKAFDHSLASYPLTGKHATVACDTCHGSPPRWKPLQSATCDACHADPHKGKFKPKACADCHDTKGWNASDSVVRGSHPKLSLANGHAAVACKTCHDRGNDRPPTKGGTCVACHPNVHAAPFGTKCETCHASIKWIGLADSIGRAAHDKTRYKLDGKHQTTACAGCHPTSKPLDVRYRNVRFDTCAACHADKHHGELTGDCAACHSVAGFAPTTLGVAQHVQTGFTLDGKHAATPCSGCHPGARPRLSWKQPKQQCADCHDNPHGTQFDKEMKSGGCAHCHTAMAWKQAKVDHSTFPLVGAHARTSCVGCHGNVAEGAAAAAFRGIPRECDGCHDDTHAGQFRTSDPVKPCAACHTTEEWKIATFDHTKTRYPLEGAHSKLECAKCHPTEELHDGTKAVRYRLGYVQCKDCHADPHRSPR
jgi:hypothetical protein